MTGLIPRIALPAIGKYVAGAIGVIIIGLVIALWVQGNRLDRVEKQRDVLTKWQENVTATTSAAAGIKDESGKPALLAKDQVAIQINNMGQAISDLRNAIAVQNAISEQRAADLVRAKASAAADEKRFAQQSAASDARLTRLAALARAAPSGQCKADPVLLRELEGL